MMPGDDPERPADEESGPHDAGVLPVADGRESAPLPVVGNERESAPLPTEAGDHHAQEIIAEVVDAMPNAGSMAGEMPADTTPVIETFDAADLRESLPPTEDGAPVEDVPDAADLPPRELRAVVESLLFVATKPMSTARLCGCLPGCSAKYLDGFLRGLADRFEYENRGWELRFIANGWQLLTRRAYHPWVRQLERKELPSKLSRSAFETLSIVAYKQPIARGAIEDIRGVQCGPVLRQLMDLKLVQVIGRDENTLGRPLLYGTTDVFLHRFGLGRIEDLPRSHEFGA